MNIVSRALGRLAGGPISNDAAPMRAVWNGVTIAESDRTVVVDGNHYFPPAALREEHLRPSTRQTVCPWKGTASYYDVVVDGERNPAAAWCYRDPKEAAAAIKDHVAFWHGVDVMPLSG